MLYNYYYLVIQQRQKKILHKPILVHTTDHSSTPSTNVTNTHTTHAHTHTHSHIHLCPDINLTVPTGICCTLASDQSTSSK